MRHEMIRKPRSIYKEDDRKQKNHTKQKESARDERYRFIRKLYKYELCS